MTEYRCFVFKKEKKILICCGVGGEEVGGPHVEDKGEKREVVRVCG